MIDRRRFANTLALGLLGAPLIARAQPTQRLAVVGVLGNATPTSRGQNVAFLVQGLRELGLVEGRDFAFEFRSSAGEPAAFAGLAAELVERNVAVIYAQGPAAVKAARDATRVIPIVAMDLETDPVGAGWARSLARPGGNLTGLFLDIPGLAGKWLDLLRAAALGIRRMGLLWDPATRSAQRVAAMAAAQAFGIGLHVMEVRSSDDTQTALRSGMSAGIGALVMLGSPEFSRPRTSKVIAAFAASHRLPAISPFRNFSDAGGLMSYGHTREHFEPRGGVFIGKILKGEKPADLAIERPSKFELVINLKTAKALGLSLPRSLLLRADEVIE